MKFTEPFIKVFVARDDIDYIHLSRENNRDGLAWKSDGFLNGELVEPDLWYEDFHDFVRHLSDFIDDTARWTNGDSGKEISVWSAIAMLAEIFEVAE